MFKPCFLFFTNWQLDFGGVQWKVNRSAIQATVPATTKFTAAVSGTSVGLKTTILTHYTSMYKPKKGLECLGICCSVKTRQRNPATGVWRKKKNNNDGS